MRKRCFDEKGITLIALVITIIVIMILVGITIKYGVGTDGIIGKSKQAANAYADSQGQEQASLDTLMAQMNGLNFTSNYNTTGGTSGGSTSGGGSSSGGSSTTGGGGGSGTGGSSSSNTNINVNIDTVASQGNTVSSSTTKTDTFDSSSITFKTSPISWTNGTVVATAYSNKTGYSVQTSKDGSGWYDSPTQEYGANGTLYARLANADGNVSTDNASISITVIDKTKPTVVATTAENQVTIHATDANSGVTGYAITTGSYTPDISTFSKVDNSSSVQLTIKNLQYSTTYYCFASDAAGNISDYFKITTAEKPGTPVLLAGMSPVKWNGSSWVFCTESDTSWYNYKSATDDFDEKLSNWANAMTTDGSMWVWIPRYEYKITQRTGDSTTAGTIQIKLIHKSQTVADDGYIIHPVFQSNINDGGFGQDTAGFWVAKYKTSGGTSTPVSKANVGVNRGTYSTASMYTSSYNYNRSYDSHLFKNSEWGAVAYLTQSQYGRNGHEVTSVATPSTSGSGGVLTSTTGNMYGVFDMVTGEYEYVSAAYTGVGKVDSSTALTASTKYVNVYNSVKGRIGDATNGDNPSTENWFSDQVGNTVTNGYLMRGNGGIFSYLWYTDAWTNASWRMALAGTTASTDGGVKFALSNSNWTNQNVSVTVSTTNEGYKIQTSLDGNTWSTYSSPIVFNKNGTLYARLVDTNGTVSDTYQTMYVSNIDKVKPSVDTLGTYANTINITATDKSSNADKQSGIVGYGYSTSSTEEPSTYMTCDSATTLYATVPDLSYSSTYYIWVKDEAGNVSLASDSTKITTDSTKLAKPTLLNNMTPVKYNTSTSKWIYCSEEDDEWYDYTHPANSNDSAYISSKWANAMTPDGSMWVWTPRYEYKVTDKGTSSAGKVSVIFISKDKTTADNGYVINPSFINDSANNYQKGGWDSELQGFWVAKYKTSNTEAVPKSVPNAGILWGGYSTYRMYTSAYNYNRTLDSHMEKNTEYGAVALLTQSQYGRNGYEISPNSTSTTGTGGDLSTTTGNVYGAYDYNTSYSNTNGSLYEYVSTGLSGYAKIDSTTTAITSGNKYINVYTGSTGIQGDATNAENPTTEGWFGDEHGETSNTNCYIMRGRNGIFTYDGYTDAYYGGAWRMVLAGNEKTTTADATRDQVNITAKPVLMDTMRPIKYSTTTSNWEFCEENDQDWYNYYGLTTTYENNSSNWANAMTADGSMWVWIPRFEYKITQRTGDTTTAGKIDVKFISKDQTVADDGYVIHPVFRNDSKYNYQNGGWNSEISGFWAAKYKSSGSTTTPASKPNAGVMRGAYSTNTMYTSSLNYNTTLNSHLLKNSEWGAIAFLTHSSYGKNGYEVKTTTSPDTAGKGGITTSTTGNISGIFDMVTNEYEYVAAGYTGVAKIDSSTATVSTSSKYLNVYDSVKGIVGDATNADIPTTEGWFSDQREKGVTSGYLMRGNSGIFSYYWYTDAWTYATWRMALTGEASQIPYVTITAAPTTSTSGNVTATVTTSLSGYKSLQTSTDGTTWTDYSNALTITKNCTVYAKLVSPDKYGTDKTYYTSLKVSNIDTVKPVIDTITSYANTITINAKDLNDSNGIVAYGISSSSSVTPSVWTSVDNCTELNATIPDLNYDTEYYLWVKDEAGSINAVTDKTHIKTQAATEKIGKPVLLTGMQPVVYDTTASKWKFCTETDSTWYDYSDSGTSNGQENTYSKWANAMTEDGSMWIWVPRYEYKVSAKGSNSAGKVNVIFLSKNKTIADNGFTINPAFINDSANNYQNGGWDSELQGFWVAKYKTSNSEATPKSIPNAGILWGGYSTYRMYTSAYNYNRSQDSHLEKNTEYGAVALLTQSQYGRNGYEIGTFNSTTTGAGGNSNSTTGNIYGVYDYNNVYSNSSGAVHEIVSAGINGYSKIDSTTTAISSGTKYINGYTATIGFQGDAMNAENPTTEGWFGDEHVDSTTTNCYLLRSQGGIFGYEWYLDAYYGGAWRMVLAGDAHQNTAAETAAKTATNATVTPLLQTGMIPIKYYDNKWNITFAEDAEWYDYYGESSSIENKTSKWANAMTVDGSMWVWIPRFEYKITQRTGDATTAGAIDVKFIPKSQTKADDGYIIHPAFINDSSNNYINGGWDKELSGFWAAKYKSGGSEATPVSKPDIGVMRGAYSVNRMYVSSLNYNKDINSHLLKNSEWGAIAYLAHSQYGKNGYQITSTKNPATAGKDGVATSTTGNIYGIFDMVSNEYEYVSAGWTGYAKIDSSTTAITASSKYINAYSNGTNGKIGDATNGDNPSTAGWYSDQTITTTSTGSAWMMRGNDGIFSFYWYPDAWTYATWRMALAE